MNSEINIPSSELQTSNSKQKHLYRLKIIGGVFTVLGIGVFAYLVHSVGMHHILDGIAKIGFGGFLIIQLNYFLRIICRATAWRLSVSAPYKLDLRDTLPAVIIGEALSSLIPLGVLVSGTAKAVAVRNRVSLVVGLSSVTMENLFYALMTGVFVCLSAVTFLLNFELAEVVVLAIYFLIGVIILLTIFGFLAVIRQWHFLSKSCEWLYEIGIGKRFLENIRKQVRLFEDLIFVFYRNHSRRFAPIISCQVAYHLLGIAEAWFILSRISEVIPSFYTAFLLESISRIIIIIFKFVPFAIGVDEAGAQFVTETLAIGAGIGVTFAIIRKGRSLFWTAIGLLLIIKREVSLKDFNREIRETH